MRPTISYSDPSRSVWSATTVHGRIGLTSCNAREQRKVAQIGRYNKDMGTVIPLAAVHPSPSAAAGGPRVPKPEWLKVRAPGSAGYVRLRSLMRELKLNTV